jgi:hypothetical protein
MGKSVARLVLVAGLVAGAVTGGASAAAEPRIGHSSPQYRWTQVNRAEPDKSYWDEERDAARVGMVTKRGVYRSMFQFDTRPFAGAVIHAVGVRITLDSSNSCRPTPVELWRTLPIDPAEPLTWNNSGDHWQGGAPLATASGNACDGQDDMSLEFDSPALTASLREAADGGAPFTTLGLRVPNERDRRQGKVFRPATAVLLVNYNNPPDAPTHLSTVPRRPCGTAAAPTPVTGSTSRQYSTVASDPDGDNISTTLEISRPDGTVVHTSEVGPTTSGSAFAWPELPEGLLAHGETYRYRARSSDAQDTGPYTEDCYLTVDAVRPGVPRLSSTDFPDGEPVTMARTTGTVTFRPATAGDDVSEYVFGFQQDRVTMRVRASADGSAVIPVTVADLPTPTARLYVRSVDLAGNQSATAPSWDLQALDNPEPPADEPGDVTGDGRPDVTAVLGYDVERTMIWRVTGREGGFHTGVVTFDTGSGGSAVDRFRTVRGDFTGDGRTDLAMLRRGTDGTASLWLLESDGNHFGARTVWESRAPFNFASASVVAGDFTGDGTSDVAVRVDQEVLVFPGGALGTPTTWSTGVQDAASRVVAADTDGDGRTDLAELRAHDGCRASLWTYRSTGNGFEPAVSEWDSGPGGYCGAGTPVAGDVDADGRDDIVAVHDHGGGDVAAMVFRASEGFSPHEWWRGTGPLRAAATPSTGDFDLDGRDDLAVVQPGGTTGETELWTLRSTGDTFAGPELGWRELTGGSLPDPR